MPPVRRKRSKSSGYAMFIDGQIIEGPVTRYHSHGVTLAELVHQIEENGDRKSREKLSLPFFEEIGGRQLSEEWKKKKGHAALHGGDIVHPVAAPAREGVCCPTGRSQVASVTMPIGARSWRRISLGGDGGNADLRGSALITMPISVR